MNSGLLDLKSAQQLLFHQGSQFIKIRNPAYLFPEYEIALLSTPTAVPVDHLKGVVMDMDGTTTTTELLCIHSQESMIRRISGRMSPAEWPGLDRRADYPHIIGNSTTRHIEYLIQTYQAMIDPESIKRAFFEAVLWTAATSRDPGRRNEMEGNVINLIGKAALHDPHWPQPGSTRSDHDSMNRIAYFLDHYGPAFHAQTSTLQVRAGIEIYYHQYHTILEEFLAGRGEIMASELLGRSDLRLIAPMPGIGIMLALLSGQLEPDDSIHLAPILLENLRHSRPEPAGTLTPDQAGAIMAGLTRRLIQNPVRFGVVTSSIRHEAHIVLSEVFRIIRLEIADWPIRPACRDRLQESFSDYTSFYHTVVTAGDSSEIRLKPHRDLYSLALHHLGIAPTDFGRVVGFEDSESGTIAIRTAGIGICVAVPFSETAHHNFQAATHIIPGGIPETLLIHHLFLTL